MLAPGGIEPTTFALLARRSNQLSYGASCFKYNYFKILTRTMNLLCCVLFCSIVLFYAVASQALPSAAKHSTAKYSTAKHVPARPSPNQQTPAQPQDAYLRVLRFLLRRVWASSFRWNPVPVPFPVLDFRLFRLTRLPVYRLDLGTML
jgi:hypothetical protein